MSVDNTHTKYLHGADKKVWNNYKEALEAQNKLGNFMSGFKLDGLKEGEEFDVPVHQSNNKKKNN